MFDECIMDFGEPFKNTKQDYPQVFHDIYHGVVIIFTTDLTNLTDRVLQGVRQKPDKPSQPAAYCPPGRGLVV